MSEPGGPRRGRHSSADGSDGPGFDLPTASARDPFPGYGVPRYEPARYEPPAWGAEPPAHPYDAAVPATAEMPAAGFRRTSGLLDRRPVDETGPLVEPEWWSYESSDDTGYVSARHARGDDEPLTHPSGPLPPRPTGVWDRLHPRDDVPGDDAQTVAQPFLGGSPLDSRHGSEETPTPVGGFRSADDDDHEAHAHDEGRAAETSAWEDQTGGLEVIGAHVEDEAHRRRRRRGRRARRHDDHHDDPAHAGGFLHHDDDHVVHDEASGEAIPVKPYDRRTGRSRRRRSPIAILVSLLVLAGLVVGIVIGGQKLFELIDPTARDYTGQGTGTIQVRVQDGDTLSDIGRTLVEADVIASIGPFVKAAENNAASTGIQPGVYELREQMSGQAALDLLLDPGSRLFSRVTLPEGLTVERTLARLAESTGRPVEEFQAAAADPSLGLPAWTGGSLEGLLFPATYDVEPDTTPVSLLRQMVTRGVQALDQLQIPEADRLTLLTKASLVQAEAAGAEDMAKVARVLENRLSDGMPLQLDTTVNYANGKSGITTTPADRANPSPYNTYVHSGLPPGPITNPGEEALRAVLAPAPGEWRFFVVVDPHTGETRFAETGAEHQQNVLLFHQWLRENPGG